MKYQILPKVLNTFIPIILTFLLLLITICSPSSKFITPPGNIFYTLSPPRAGVVILTSLTLLNESNCTYRFQNVAARTLRPLETFLILLITFISPNSNFVAPRNFVYYALPSPRGLPILSHESNC